MKNAPCRIAVLASTNGTDFQALLDEAAVGRLPGVEIACLITNKAGCGAVQKAGKARVPVHFIDPADKDRQAYDKKVLAALRPYKIDLIVLVGYMRIIGPAMVRAYRNRILNVHPSLLPKFAGGMNMDVHQAVLDAGETETGMTIHLVTNDLDGGPVVCRKAIPVGPTDSPAILKEKVQALEKEWYPEVIRWFAAGKVHIKGKTVCIDD